MNLVIENPDNIDLNGFCKSLIVKMQEYMHMNMNPFKLYKWDEFLNSGNFVRRYFSKAAVSTAEILLASTYNLIVRQQRNLYIIEIDPSINIPNTSAKFINIVNLITYGNLSCPAYNIYNEMMRYFADNLQYYYELYLEEVN